MMNSIYGPLMSELSRSTGRERTPTSVPRSMTDGGMMGQQTQQALPQSLGGGMSPSQGIFQAYMQQLFQQKYQPQQALGGYQNMGGYGAFMPPSGQSLMGIGATADEEKKKKQQTGTNPGAGYDPWSDPDGQRWTAGA